MGERLSQKVREKSDDLKALKQLFKSVQSVMKERETERNKGRTS